MCSHVDCARRRGLKTHVLGKVDPFSSMHTAVCAPKIAKKVHVESSELFSYFFFFFSHRPPDPLNLLDQQHSPPLVMMVQNQADHLRE